MKNPTTLEVRNAIRSTTNVVGRQTYTDRLVGNRGRVSYIIGSIVAPAAAERANAYLIKNGFNPVVYVTVAGTPWGSTKINAICDYPS